MEIKNIKKEFPIFKQKINGKPLVYLDSANSSQKPKVVIDKISNFYETEFSNVGRSVPVSYTHLTLPTIYSV